jgi:nucleotide-binding universal stress UspA family protein
MSGKRQRSVVSAWFVLSPERVRTGMTQVLIAVDDSESSVKTARTAYALFGDKASYIVVNVADQTPMVWGGDALVWGVGYPIVMAPTGIVDPTVNRAEQHAYAPGEEGAALEVDTAPIDAAIQVARDVAAEADLPNPQVVGEVGDPVMAIITAAHHHQADVIVIGSHDRSWFSKLLAPSVTGAVVREADIPVLIAR